MGKVIASFNPFDPGDPSYQMQEDGLYNMTHGVAEDYKQAGSNFYPADEPNTPEFERNEIGGNYPADGFPPRSYQEMQTEEEL